jgi:tellurite methyltransferase
MRMHRRIIEFHQDGEGDWIAELACLHSQHVRHRPPFFDRPWVLEDAGREARLGTDLDCPLCDRCELPDDLHLARTAGPFDESTLPPGLRRPHHVASGSWGVLRVLAGDAELHVATEPPTDARIVEGGSQPIPPEVEHVLSLGDGAVVEVDFLVRDVAS